MRAADMHADTTEQIGLRDAIRARMAELADRALDVDRETIGYDGVTYSIPAGHFWKAIKTLAEDLWTEYHMRPLPEHPLQDEEFRRFYDRVRHLVSNDPLIEKRGSPAPADCSHPERKGLLWKAEKELNGLQRGEGPPDVVLCAANADNRNLVGQVDVGSQYRQNVARETDLHKEFAWTKTHSDHSGPRFESKGISWLQRKARAADGYRPDEDTPKQPRKPWHRLIGHWMKGSVGDRDAWVTVPWIPADIDGESWTDSLQKARRLVRRLESFGVDPDHILVVETGGRGFHVYLRHSAVGCPIYRNADVAKERIRTLWKAVCGDDQELFAAIDPSCFSPLQSLRAAGSIHESHDGSKRRPDVRFSVAMKGSNLLAWGADYIRGLSTGPDCSDNQRDGKAGYYQPSSIPNPHDGQAVSSLVAVTREGGTHPLVLDTIENRQPGAPMQELISRIRGGVKKGENWACGTGYTGIGRNKAAWTLSLHLHASKDPPDDPWRIVKEWNQRNEPALDVGELRRAFNRAKPYANQSYRAN